MQHFPRWVHHKDEKDKLVHSADLGHGFRAHQLFGGCGHPRPSHGVGAKCDPKQVGVFAGVECVLVCSRRSHGNLRRHRGVGPVVAAVGHQLRH